MPKKHLSARAQAARTLAQVLQQQINLTALFSASPRQDDPRAQALAQELCYGACRWFHQLDAILETLVRKPFKAKDTDIRALALIGLYQLIHLQTPPHAAVSETVNASHELGKRWAAGLLNALLRRFLREQPSIMARMEPNPTTRWSLPVWLIDRIQLDWPEQASGIFEAGNQRPPMMLRVNQRQYSREAYLLALKESGLAATAIPFTAYGIQLAAPCSVQKLPGFDEGVVSVQDGAAQIATELLDLQPHLRVLDACAAPGGKTAHMLEAVPGLETLVAVEVQTDRCDTLRQNLARLKLQADVVCGDARQPQHWHSGGLFDRILIDAPCSATGVIRRHPDIKLLRKESDISAIANQQRQLLDALWPLLTPGGLLLYTTCSLLKCENEQQMDAFLTRHRDARESPIETDWGIACSVGRQRFPGDQSMDGFYYARLLKAA